MTCAPLLARLCVRLQRQSHLPYGVLTQHLAPGIQGEGSQRAKQLCQLYYNLMALKCL
jgi:hypothetical protein